MLLLSRFVLCVLFCVCFVCVPLCPAKQAEQRFETSAFLLFYMKKVALRSERRKYCTIYNVILFVTVTNKDFFKSNKGTENNINNSIEVVASKDFLPFGDSIPCSYRLSLVLETKLVIMPHPRHKERRKGFE